MGLRGLFVVVRTPLGGWCPTHISPRRGAQATANHELSGTGCIDTQTAKKRFFLGFVSYLSDS
jgi:hypothetical protein